MAGTFENSGRPGGRNGNGNTEILTQNSGDIGRMAGYGFDFADNGNGRIAAVFGIDGRAG